MSIKIPSLTPGCAPSSASESPQSKAQPVENTLPPVRWSTIPAKPIYNEMGYVVAYSHYRSVFISSSIPGAQHRWVAKLETAQVRSKKCTYFPHAEEIAYKIAKKLLHWNTVPKTKILHQFSLENPIDKYQKYYSLMKYFMDTNYAANHPATFTFQTLVKGETLPSHADLAEGVKQKPDILPSSYHRAILLSMILGKDDARGDNTMYDPQTREIFEIDNEYLGVTGYSGILDVFTELANLGIEKEILENVLRIQPDQLAKIQTKYTARNAHLRSLQARELRPTIPASDRIVREKWGAIFDNLFCIQETIRSLCQKDRSVTIEQLKIDTELRLKALQEERSAKELEEQLKKEKAEIGRVAKEKELRIMEPPKISNNLLGDIHKWLRMGHCVVLHSRGENAHIYYEGEEPIEDLRVIHVDVASSTGHLEEWPMTLEMVGIFTVDAEFHQQILNPSRSRHPRETFYLKFGY